MPATPSMSETTNTLTPLAAFRSPRFQGYCAHDLAAAVAHRLLGKLVDPGHAPERRADCPVPAVLRLQRDAAAVGVGRAEEPFRAALRDPAVAQPHQICVAPAGRRPHAL